jgi:hypothetical protein
MQILTHYVLPNVALFGGICLLAKYVEHSVQYYIDNYEESQKMLKGIFKGE